MASPIAIAVVPYPPPIADEDTHSTEPKGFMSAYHQRREPAKVPVVTFVQVRSEPLTPRPLAIRPAVTH